MPKSDDARQWFITVGKLLAPKSPELNTDTIAKKLGLKKASILTSCIRDSATNTTRQIVKLLYPQGASGNRRGKSVTVEKRKLIKGKFSLKNICHERRLKQYLR